MDTFNPSALKQRLRYELAGLDSRDLEQQAVGGVRLVLQELRNGPQIKSALQELLSGLDTCSKHAVKLRLQLAEYSVLKCCSKAQLPGLLPFLTKQANSVLAKNRNDGPCISSLAALMSSCLAKLLHEPPGGSYAALHGPIGSSMTAEEVCEALLFPAIRSTYRDPEQARVAAGSVVLLGMLEVMKAYAPQSEEVVGAVRHCLALMVQLLGTGNLAQRVPGVLLPACTCLDVLGVSTDRDCAKRLLLLCLKGAVVKDAWQVRRDALQTLAVLAASLLGMPTIDDAGDGAEGYVTPAVEMLIARKQQVVQVLENARYDKIATVRVAAAAALAKILILPDPPKPATPVPNAEPSPAAADSGSRRSTRTSSIGSSSSIKMRAGQAVAASAVKQSKALSAAPTSAGQPGLRPIRFKRPQQPPGTVMDYGVQVFAPPSPPRRPQAEQSPAKGSGDATPEAAADQSPVRRQLEFAGTDKLDSQDRLRRSVDASSQTCQACGPAPQAYTVQSPLGSTYSGQHPFGLVGAVPGSPLSATAAAAAAAAGQYFASDALQVLDQNQQQHGLSAMLAAGAGVGSQARLDVSHHVHGRVELGITYSPMGSPLRADAGAAPPPGAAAAAAVGAGGSSPAGAAAAGLFGSWAPGMQQGWWPAAQPNPQQQPHHHQQQQQEGFPQQGPPAAAAYPEIVHGQQQQQQQQQQEGLPQQGPPAAAAYPVMVDGQQQQQQQQSPGSAAGPGMEPSFSAMPPGSTSPDLPGHTAAAAGPNAGDDVAACAPDAEAEEGDAAVGAGQHVEYQYPAFLGSSAVSPVEAADDETADAPQQEILPCGSSSSSSSIGAGEEQRARKARQRWQLPEMAAAAPPAPSLLDAASEQATAAAGSAATGSAATDSAPDQLEGDGARGEFRPSGSSSRASSSRASSRQFDRGPSRQGSRSAHEPGTSLDVLRSVGERVQGLLDALSRQTSGGGSGRQSAGGGVDASLLEPGTPLGNNLTGTPAALQQQGLEQQQQQQSLLASPEQQAAMDASIAASRAESFKLLASLKQLSADSSPGNLPLQVAAKSNLGGAVAEEQLAGAAGGSLAWPLSPSRQGGLRSPSRLSRCTSLAELSTRVAAGTGGDAGFDDSLDGTHGSQQLQYLEQQQQQCKEGHQEHAGLPEGRVSMQFNELFQHDSAPVATTAPLQASLDGSGAAGGAAANVEPELASRSTGSITGAAAGSAGLAQVERALQKLQTLRSTLQSIGNSATSSRQVSCRESRAASGAGSAAISTEVSSSDVPPNATGSSLLAQQDSAAGTDVAAAPSAAAQGEATGSEGLAQQADESAGHSQQQQQHTSALTTSTRDWIRQISERLQQAGTSDTLRAAAAELEAVAAHAGASEGQVFSQSEGGYSPADAESQQLGAATAAAAADLAAPGSCGPDGTRETVASTAEALGAAQPSALPDDGAVVASASSADQLAEALFIPQQLQPESQLTHLAQAAGSPATPGSTDWSTATANTGSVAGAGSDSQAAAGQSRLGLGLGLSTQQQSAWATEAASPADDAPASALAGVADVHNTAAAAPGCGQSSAAAVSDVLLPAAAEAAGSDRALATAPAAAGRLQQMLDASDDTALLMSLAMKLNMLATKFKGQGAEAAGTAGVGSSAVGLSHLPGSPDHSAAGGMWGSSTQANSFSGSPARWNSITHNELYVSSPVRGMPADAAEPGSGQQAQQQTAPAGSSRTAPHGTAVATWAASQSASPDGVRQQYVVEPWVDVQDAALQIVLGLTLQELQHGGSQVVSQVGKAVAGLQFQLEAYKEQPLAGMSGSPGGMGMHLHSIAQGLEHSTGPGGAASKRQQGEKQVQPLLVLLMHAYQQAVHDECRARMLQRMLMEGGSMQHGDGEDAWSQQQQQQLRYGWEALAEAAAEEQVQWFARECSGWLVNLLLSVQAMGGST